MAVLSPFTIDALHPHPLLCPAPTPIRHCTAHKTVSLILVKAPLYSYYFIFLLSVQYFLVFFGLLKTKMDRNILTAPVNIPSESVSSVKTIRVERHILPSEALLELRFCLLALQLPICQSIEFLGLLQLPSCRTLLIVLQQLYLLAAILSSFWLKVTEPAARTLIYSDKAVPATFSLQWQPPVVEFQECLLLMGLKSFHQTRVSCCVKRSL